MDTGLGRAKWPRLTEGEHTHPITVPLRLSLEDAFSALEHMCTRSPAGRLQCEPQVTTQAPSTRGLGNKAGQNIYI
jgi:hypothetical protein